MGVGYGKIINLDRSEWINQDREVKQVTLPINIGRFISYSLCAFLFFWFMNSSYRKDLDGFFVSLLFGG